MTEHTDSAANVIRAKAAADASMLKHPGQRIGSGAEIISADSVRARLSAEAQQHVDAKMAEWFGHESELGAFALEDVRELGKHAI